MVALCRLALGLERKQETSITAEEQPGRVAAAVVALVGAEVTRSGYCSVRRRKLSPVRRTMSSNNGDALPAVGRERAFSLIPSNATVAVAWVRALFQRACRPSNGSSTCGGVGPSYFASFFSRLLRLPSYTPLDGPSNYSLTW